MANLFGCNAFGGGEVVPNNRDGRRVSPAWMALIVGFRLTPEVVEIGTGWQVLGHEPFSMLAPGSASRRHEERAIDHKWDAETESGNGTMIYKMGLGGLYHV